MELATSLFNAASGTTPALTCEAREEREEGQRRDCVVLCYFLTCFLDIISNILPLAFAFLEALVIALCVTLALGRLP